MTSIEKKFSQALRIGLFPRWKSLYLLFEKESTLFYSLPKQEAMLLGEKIKLYSYAASILGGLIEDEIWALMENTTIPKVLASVDSIQKFLNQIEERSKITEYRFGQPGARDPKYIFKCWGSEKHIHDSAVSLQATLVSVSIESQAWKEKNKIRFENLLTEQGRRHIETLKRLYKDAKPQQFAMLAILLHEAQLLVKDGLQQQTRLHEALTECFGSQVGDLNSLQYNFSQQFTIRFSQKLMVEKKRLYSALD